MIWFLDYLIFVDMNNIRTHKDLKVYQTSFEAGVEIYKTTKAFPHEELYSLTDQMRRSSRSVSANIAEAFRKRRYQKSFLLKLSDAEGEAAETQVWLDYALEFGLIKEEQHKTLFDKYEHILSMISKMTQEPEKWTWK